MKRVLTMALAVAATLGLTKLNAQQRIDPLIESKVDALVKQMTLEEKIGQMAQVSIESLGSLKGQQFSFSDKLKDAVINYKVGSILNTPGALQSASDWNRILTEIQRPHSKLN